ncbi:hypothetical protein ACSBR2_040959 [Camellia fascicularis]
MRGTLFFNTISNFSERSNFSPSGNFQSNECKIEANENKNILSAMAMPAHSLLPEELILIISHLGLGEECVQA